MSEDPDQDAGKDPDSPEAGEPSKRSLGVLEIGEAILLALVTLATAWSGYQAARWDGHNALHYGEASKYRARATQLSTAGGQQKILDIVTFNTWILAETNGQKKLAALYIRRFSPQYRVAFDAWLKTHPLTNPNAPQGPSFMPQYHNHLARQSVAFNTLASKVFQEGTDAREIADKYVKSTVLLASILFVIALGQRFKFRGVRHALLGAAFVLLVYSVYTLLGYPVA
jgi:hypothetical protein